MENINKKHYAVYKSLIYVSKCLIKVDCFAHIVNSKRYDLIANIMEFDSICGSYEQFQQSEDRGKIKNDIIAICQNWLYSPKAKEFKCSNEDLHNNLNLLKQYLQLSEVDCALIELAVIANSESSFLKYFLDTIDKKGYGNINELHTIIAAMIDCTCDEVAFALSKNGTLIKMSILKSKLNNTIMGALRFCDDDLRYALEQQNDYATLAKFFNIFPCTENILNLSNYTHIKNLNRAIEYLKSAKDSRAKGANILIYGIRGAGKTELAKIIAKEVGVTLYNINLHTDKRINCYDLAQNVLDSSNAMLLYDEMEDLLAYEKGRLNYEKFFGVALTENNIPTIWIANKDIYDVECGTDKNGTATNERNAIKSRFTSKFSFVFSMNLNDSNIRNAMLDKVCDDRLDAKTLGLIYDNPNITQAIIKKANKISNALSGDFSENFLAVVNNTLKSQEQCEISNITKNADSYSTEFINTDIDVDGIISGLQDAPNARICLYGMSGTGKSAFAKHIAKMLRLPCLVKPVSDLETSLVGETEQNIAKAFREANSQNAVLVFDEVDSFLSDRRNATHNWECTKVNEMLTQLEIFDGIFIATTNLMDRLDKAVLRRFDLKFEFKALNSEQRKKLFEKECEILGLKCNNLLKKQIAGLDNLTPGDFAAVKRQNRFSRIKDADDFYRRLCNEVEVKKIDESDKVSNIGFLKSKR